MKAKAWEKRIIESCAAAGTYRTYFDDVIKTLAFILEKRDEAEKMYEENHMAAVVKYTNKAGATNIVKNPVLGTIGDLNAQALQYWRDLGLTPNGLKKLNEEAMTVQKKRNTLGEALARIESQLS